MSFLAYVLMIIGAGTVVMLTGSMIICIFWSIYEDFRKKWRKRHK